MAMACSPQVFRYSALTFGILYGFLHRRTLQSAYDEHKIELAVHSREKVIKEAKEAWKREKSAGLNDGGEFVPWLHLVGSFYMNEQTNKPG